MKLAFDEIRPNEYSEAKDAAAIATDLIAAVDEHAHLGEAAIGYVFRDDEIRRRGKVVAAECILVARILQSEKRYARLVKWALLRILNREDLPHFLVLIDKNIWDGMDEAERTALVDHELSHAAQDVEDDGVTPRVNKQTGEPIWAIRGHDCEEFCGVILRNGLWNEDLRTMGRAVVDRLVSEAEPA